MTNNKITAQRVRDLLNYNPDTGIFTWRWTRGGKFAGSVAGMPRYRQHRLIGWTDEGEEIFSERVIQNIAIKIDGVTHSASILAWLYMTGRYPVGTIMRLEGDGSDNRWCNLRSRSIYDDRENARVPSFL